MPRTSSRPASRKNSGTRAFKGNAVDVIVWQTATARLLPRLLKRRRTGPVFLTDRRARVQLPPGDLDPATGRARLSYRRAAELFEQATAVCPGGPWALHQLRHSALTHAAEAGANTATLLAYSGHTSVASLARYARVSPAALARWQARRDPAAPAALRRARRPHRGFGEIATVLDVRFADGTVVRVRQQGGANFSETTRVCQRPG